MKKFHSGERGFTLVEIIFVLAIILTLVAIFLPLATSKLSEANVTKAQSDEDAISAALTTFFSDLGIWPASDGGGTNSDNMVLRTLLVGDASPGVSPNTINSPNPTLGSGVSYFTTGTTLITSGTTFAAPEATVNNAFNHLAVNNPDANATENDRATGDYRTTGGKRWRGPYIAKLSTDPFGNNYVINIGAIVGTSIPSVVATEKGWVLSAGSDGILSTANTASALSGDDIGYIFCTNCK